MLTDMLTPLKNNLKVSIGLKCPHYPQAIYRFNAMLSKFQWHRSQIAKANLRKNKAGGITFPNFKQPHKAMF